MKLNCAIVEDDIFSLLLVERLIARCGLLNILSSFTSPKVAIPWLTKNPVDLLFLDMEMPDISGLELLRSLSNKPDVIIITSKPAYAAEAFEFAVIDYLIKPVQDYGRFLAAVQKAFAKRSIINEVEKETIFVKVDSLLLKIDINDILWIEAFGDYIKIQVEEKIYTVYSTLKKTIEKLPKKKFIRVHRSFVVNISRITNIDPNNLEINKKIIPISASYKDELLTMINIL